LLVFVKKPRRSTTAPVFFVSICKPIQQNCIFQALETHPKEIENLFSSERKTCFLLLTDDHAQGK
jgi:hypothetical protein